MQYAISARHFKTFSHKSVSSLANSGKEVEICLVGVKRLRCKVLAVLRHRYGWATGDHTLVAKLVRRISLLKLPLINIYAYRIGEPGVLLFSLSNESPVDLRTCCEHITKTKLRNQCL